MVFQPIDTTAAYILIPYACWVGFAVMLSFRIWRLNPAPTGERRVRGQALAAGFRNNLVSNDERHGTGGNPHDPWQ